MDKAILSSIIDEHYQNEPHPSAPQIKVKDYPAFARVAMMMKGSLPDSGDVQHAHQMLSAVEVSPAQFEHSWTMARPIANRLLNRDPTISEIKQLANQHPAEYHDFYGSQPHPEYPEVKAGEMVKMYHAAYPISMKLKNREPNSLEIARFASAEYDSQDMQDHYMDKW